MRHEGPVSSAQFSPDGQRVLTASADKTARVWDAPTTRNQDEPSDVLLLADLAEAACGSVLEASGQAEILHILDPKKVRDNREKIAARFPGPISQLTSLQRFLKWTASDRRNRTISPFSEVTLAEWIKNRITDGTLDGLRAAVQLDPTNALLAAFPRNPFLLISSISVKVTSKPPSNNDAASPATRSACVVSAESWL
jgi:WD40 repeat protein